MRAVSAGGASAVPDEMRLERPVMLRKEGKSECLLRLHIREHFICSKAGSITCANNHDVGYYCVRCGGDTGPCATELGV